MNKISRMLFVALIFMCLFAVVAAAGTKNVYVKDSSGNTVINKHVTINHNNSGYECDTDNNGRCMIEDKVRNGDLGKFRDSFGNEGDSKVEDRAEIPEFPTVALPVAAMIGLVFLFRNRKNIE